MRWLAVVLLVSVIGLPAQAEAHDDPVVTVRVLCNGFNSLDMDAVLGEISDSATLTVDRPVHGLAQIEQWVQQQMDNDLRIEIVNIGTPQQLPDGYTLSWTARFSRQDWRLAGVQARQVSNTVVIHNGRITQWTAELGATADPQPATASGAVVGTSNDSMTAMPEMYGIPISLVVGAIVAITGAGLLVRSIARK